MTLSLAYDLPIKKEGDPYVALAEEAINSLALAVIPGKFLVDLIPILKYVPSWMPGAGFKRKAKEWHQLQERFRNEPYDFTVRKMVSLGVPLIVHFLPGCDL